MASAPASAAAVKDYGKPGEAINLVIGYQPYYTESWSGVVMRDKKFYEKYLPKGSTVAFQIGLQGAIIVNGMLAGKVDVGYVGDMPAIVSTSHAEIRDIRMVAAVGLGQDQCNNFLVSMDAPKFDSPEEAIKWLDGKHVAVPKGAAPTASRKRCSNALTLNRPSTSIKASRLSPAASARRSSMPR